MGEGWCDNPSGSRPNFFGRQHLTFEKGGKGVGDFRGIVRFFERLLSCSCNDVLTKLLMLCRCGKCFRRCW